MRAIRRSLQWSPRWALLLAAVAAAPGGAQTVAPDSGFRLRVAGDIAVAAGEREAGVVVIRGAARVDGHVGAVIVVDGTATVDGGRVGELVVIRGRALLGESAVVTGDVHLLEAELERAAGARVEGTVERGMGRRTAGEFLAALALLGVGVVAALVLAGVLAALVVPEGLRATGSLIRTAPGRVAGSAALVWLAGPVAALLLVVTVIGLPLGLGYLAFVLPVLGLTGLVVSGTWIGDEVLRRVRSGGAARRPVAAAIVGILLLVLLGRLPLLGIVSTLLVMLGAGAAVLAASRAARGRRPA